MHALYQHNDYELSKQQLGTCTFVPITTDIIVNSMGSHLCRILCFWAKAFGYAWGRPKSVLDIVLQSPEWSTL